MFGMKVATLTIYTTAEQYTFTIGIDARARFPIILNNSLPCN